jgi:hypothetical protein
MSHLSLLCHTCHCCVTLVIVATPAGKQPLLTLLAVGIRHHYVEKVDLLWSCVLPCVVAIDQA